MNVRNNFYRAFYICISIIALSLSLFACKKDDSTVMKAGVAINVGVNAEFPPFETLENNRMDGFDIDLINHIATIIGVEIKLVNMPFDELIPALTSGKIDLIISGMTVTDERKKLVNFSDTYFISKQAIILNEEDNRIKSFNNLINYKTGVMRDYTGDVLVTDLGGAVVRYDADNQAIIGLKTGKIDAVVIDSEPAKTYVQYFDGLKIIETDLAEEEYAIAVSKEKPKLLNDINNALAKLKADGTYNSLIDQYFGK